MLPVGTEGAVGAIGNQFFNKLSAGGASRGQLTPESTGAVVGSTMNNISQFLLPYMLQMKQYQMQLPEQLMSNRLGFLTNVMGASAPLLGSRSTYSGNSFGFGAQVAPSGGQNNKPNVALFG